MRWLIWVFLLLFGILVLLSSPVWGYMLWNDAKAYRIRLDLESVLLPENASLLTTTHRVFNDGNSDGCDYQAIAVVEHWGKVSDLTEAYLELLQRPRYMYGDGQLYIGRNDHPDHWSAIVRYKSTELYIRPNTDRSSLYLIDLAVKPRDVSPDLRCW